MRVHRGLGIEDRLRAGRVSPGIVAQPRRHTGKVTNDIRWARRSSSATARPISRSIAATCMRRWRRSCRRDMRAPRQEAHRPSTQRGARVELSFADGSAVEADAVIGADGVHSLVREYVVGARAAALHGRLAYRTTFPAARLRGARSDRRAPSGGGRTATSSSTSSLRSATRSISSPASRSTPTGSPGNPGRRRATSRSCARRSRTSIPTCARSWRRARGAQVGHLRARPAAAWARAACRCWAMPVIR